MNQELLDELQGAQQALEPQFQALRGATSALQQAIRLASEEKIDALPMQKALIKLQQAAEAMEDEPFQAVAASFAAETQKALDALAFEFARDLKETFERRGQVVSGRPPTLVVDPLVLQIDIAARKAQWFYGKEALTRSLPLSLNALVKAFDQQYRAIAERKIDVDVFLQELYDVWKEMVESRPRRPAGGRLNLVEVYSKLVMNRQSGRFWNAPSRATFRDYERALFVRDLVLAHASPRITVEGQRYLLRLGAATKSQADSASRSVWVPDGALDGQYYADISFEEI
ncbi:MAG: hypothetical protein H0T73_08495 [Ardenticatenales bacterium]|nr:hypothetical protein [Ardenticatenales bacterium]